MGMAVVGQLLLTLYVVSLSLGVDVVELLLLGLSMVGQPLKVLIVCVLKLLLGVIRLVTDTEELQGMLYRAMIDGRWIFL